MEPALTIHGGCVLVGEAGVLVRGPSGSGKSALARRLVAAAAASGRFARLVADDRVRLHACHGRLIARPVPAIAGLSEMRGVGVVAGPHEAGAVVRLVVDIARESPERLPDLEARETEVAGVRLPRVTGIGGVDLADWVLARLAEAGARIAPE